MTPPPNGKRVSTPMLLFNDECAVCRRIARWVRKSAKKTLGEPQLVLRPIGDDPEALTLLNPQLDIWDAYETIHLLMPDGSMKLGGDAVAEVLRRLPNCRWFAWAFNVGILGFRPFQRLLDGGYAFLSAVRPLLGCESCGIPSRGVRFVHSILRWFDGNTRKESHRKWTPHFTATRARTRAVPSIAPVAAPQGRV